MTAEGGAGLYPTAAVCRCSVPAQGQITSSEAQGTLPVLRQRGESWGQAAAWGKLVCFYKMHLAVLGAGYLVRSPPLEGEQDTLRLRDGSMSVGNKLFFYLSCLRGEM